MEREILEIGAEMMLNYLYPELEDLWTARHDGTFYRNYNRDVLSMDPGTASVRLSRDGFLSLLPQGLLTQEQDLKGGDWTEKHKELEMQLKLLAEAFLPFDSFAFRRRLKLERSISGLLDQKLSYLVKTYFGFDIEAEQNAGVRELAMLLPYISRRRGDFGLIKELLGWLFGCTVEQQERRYSQQDSTRYWLPLVRYELLIPELTAADFRELSADVEAVQVFLERWFMPVEVKLEIVVKQHGVTAQMGGPMTLNYNTEL